MRLKGSLLSVLHTGWHLRFAMSSMFQSVYLPVANNVLISIHLCCPTHQSTCLSIHLSIYLLLLWIAVKKATTILEKYVEKEARKKKSLQFDQLSQTRSHPALLVSLSLPFSYFSFFFFLALVLALVPLFLIFFPSLLRL